MELTISTIVLSLAKKAAEEILRAKPNQPYGSTNVTGVESLPFSSQKGNLG